MIMAKLYGFPNFLESNTYNDGEVTRLTYREKLVRLVGQCVEELGIRGMWFILVQLFSLIKINQYIYYEYRSTTGSTTSKTCMHD